MSETLNDTPFVSDSDIIDLEKYFEGLELPKSVKLDKCSTITDVRKFVENHFSVVKANRNNPKFEIYFERLTKLKELLIN